MSTFPPSNGALLNGKKRRDQPGKAFLGHWVHLLPRITQRGNWLRGSDGNLSRIPFHIASALEGMPFGSFDELRKAIWKRIAADDFVSGIYLEETRRQEAIASGVAPRAPAGQQLERVKVLLSGGSVPLGLDPLGRVSGVLLESSEVTDTLKSYHLHHHHPIHQGGAVYELSNLIIVSPRLHGSLLAREYHLG